MRQRMIEALTYPRMVLLANLESEACPQNRMFNASHESCQACEQSEDCQWLNTYDDFSVLANMPMDSLYECLKFCMEYVATASSSSHHNVTRCPCESCDWVRATRRLATEYRNSMESPRGSAGVARY